MNQKSDAPDWSSYKLGWEDGVMAERQSHRQTHLHTAPVDAVNMKQERVDETAKGEHEPVAWMYVNRDGECEQIEHSPIPDDPSATPLYTAPPQRKPLTDEEIETIANDFEEGYVFLYRSFARAIEAAHGIGEKE